MCVSPSILVFVLAYAKGHKKRKKKKDKQSAALSSKGGDTNMQVTGKKVAPASAPLKRRKNKKSKTRRTKKTSARGTLATLPHLTNCVHRVSQQSVFECMWV